MSTEAGTDAALSAMLNSGPKDADDAHEEPTPGPEETQGDEDEDADDTEGTEELGDAGKKALERMKDKLKEERRRRIAAERVAASKADDDDAAKIRREAEEAAVAKANSRIVRAEIRAAAAGKLADPADALAFLSTDDFEVDEDGDVDSEEIADAIDDLLRRKPHLAAQGGTRRPKPDRSQGAQGTGKTDTSQQFASAISNAL